MKCILLFFNTVLMAVLVIMELENGQVDASSDFDDILVNAVNAFKPMMKTGVPKYGIPVLDPLIIVNKTFDINNDNIKLKGSFSAEIDNLSNFGLNDLSADMDLNTALNITFFNVKMKGHYSVNGIIAKLIPITGDGNHELTFQQFNFGIKPTLSANNGYLKMIDSGFTFVENDLQIFIDGLLEGRDLSAVLKYFLNDVISALLSRNMRVAQLINSSIVKSFNIDGRGKDIYNIIENVKSLATATL